MTTTTMVMGMTMFVIANVEAQRHCSRRHVIISYHHRDYRRYHRFHVHDALFVSCVYTKCARPER